jgi:hypothetical protein
MINNLSHHLKNSTSNAAKGFAEIKVQSIVIVPVLQVAESFGHLRTSSFFVQS